MDTENDGINSFIPNKQKEKKEPLPEKKSEGKDKISASVHNEKCSSR